VRGVGRFRSGRRRSHSVLVGATKTKENTETGAGSEMVHASAAARHLLPLSHFRSGLAALENQRAALSTHRKKYAIR